MSALPKADDSILRSYKPPAQRWHRDAWKQLSCCPGVSPWSDYLQVRIIPHDRYWQTKDFNDKEMFRALAILHVSTPLSVRGFGNVRSGAGSSSKVTTATKGLSSRAGTCRCSAYRY